MSWKQERNETKYRQPGQALEDVLMDLAAWGIALGICTLVIWGLGELAKLAGGVR